jgi:hypothetical protein
MATKAPPKRNLPRVARLVLVIAEGEEETLYTVVPLNPDKRVAHPAWRLRKDLAGDPYDVWQDQHGGHCTCPGHTYRRTSGKPCKHLAALRACGLMPKE